jgi:hypothetical protein
MRQKSPLALAALVALVTAVALVAKTINILEDMTPEAPKKPIPGYSAEGRSAHYRDQRLDVRASFLPAGERAAWYAEKGMGDPFAAFLRPEENYVFFRVRFENLQKVENVEFSPGSSMFGTANLVDDIAVYELLYKETDGEERLACAGKALFLKPLHLPPGQWIERLLVYKYDESYQMRKVPLVLSNILLGREGIDIEFSFLPTFKKEKKK